MLSWACPHCRLSAATAAAADPRPHCRPFCSSRSCSFGAMATDSVGSAGRLAAGACLLTAWFGLFAAGGRLAARFFGLWCSGIRRLVACSFGMRLRE